MLQGKIKKQQRRKDDIEKLDSNNEWMKRETRKI